MKKSELNKSIEEMLNGDKSDISIQERESDDEKKIAFSISVREALQLLFQDNSNNLMRMTQLSNEQIFAIAQCREMDKLFTSFYGNSLYTDYCDNFMRLKISLVGKGRKQILELVESMKIAEEKESILKDVGMISKLRNFR